MTSLKGKKDGDSEGEFYVFKRVKSGNSDFIPLEMNFVQYKFYSGE